MTYIRLAPNWITEATITGSDSYRVDSFPTQADMTGHYRWFVTQQDTFKRPISLGLDGSGNYNGNWAGSLIFGLLTPDMTNYIYDTILQGKPRNAVTAYVYVGGHIGTSPQGWETIQGYGQFHLTDGSSNYRQPRRGYYTNVRFDIDTGTAV